MYIKHPIKAPTGRTRTVKHIDPQSGEEKTVEREITDWVPIGRLDKKIYDALSDEDKKMLKEKRILFKTETEAYTVPEPEGMKLVDKQKDNTIEKDAEKASS